MMLNHITGNTQFYVYLHRKAPLKANFKVCHLLPPSYPLPNTHPIQKMLEETSICSSADSYPSSSAIPTPHFIPTAGQQLLCKILKYYSVKRCDLQYTGMLIKIPEKNSGSSVTEGALLKMEKSVLPDAYYYSLVLDRASFQKLLSTRSCLTDERLPNFPGKMYRQHIEDKIKCISSTSQAEWNN